LATAIARAGTTARAAGDEEVDFGFELGTLPPLARCAACTTALDPFGAATPAATLAADGTGNALPPPTAASIPKGTS
jgi:hypothetical protein